MNPLESGRRPREMAQPLGMVDVRDFGAMPDGRTLCTHAIQAAVDACADAGGGRVVLAGGTYLSGTIRLRSHVILDIAHGATLLGSTNLADYPEIAGDIVWLRHGIVTRSLIFAENIEGPGLTGGGVIDGQGSAWFFSLKEAEAMTPEQKDRDRPFLIRMIGCRDVRVEGLRLRNSAMWMQHYLGCERLTLRGLHVCNFCNHNNDSLDLDGCRQATVSDCLFESGDDGITLKSTFPRPSEQIAIANCVVRTYANGIKFGTESTGGFRDVTIANCVIDAPQGDPPYFGVQSTYGGLALEIVDGGTLERVAISNLTMRNVNVPIFFRLGDRARRHRPDAPRPAVGAFRDVTVDNVIATGAARLGCSITGLPDARVENVSLSNLQLEFAGGGERALSEEPVDEMRDAYPDGHMFGALPAYGFYCRHVAGLRLSGVRLRTRVPDLRSAVVCEDVTDLRIADLDAAPAPGAAPVLRLKDAREAQVWSSRSAAEAADLPRKP